MMRLKQKKDIVYVVGAGASHEANLPTGDKLKREIAQCLDFTEPRHGHDRGDMTIKEAFRMSVNHIEGSPDRNIASYMEASRHIMEAMPQAPSIDNFIDTHSGDEHIELCGKLAIVQTILSSERESLLYIDPSNIYNKMNFITLEETWYSKFFKLVIEGCNKEQLKERFQLISMVVFNYDRCVEHFLVNALQNYYRIPEKEAAELVNEIIIFHPYGVVGTLPWQGGRSITYGGKAKADEILHLASQIKTFTEGTDPDSSDIQAMREKIASAARIVFLGFAYHDLNLKLINPEVPKEHFCTETSYFGTAYGVSKSDCEIIKSLVTDMKNTHTNRCSINNELTCAKLFDEYSRSLTLNSIYRT